MSRIIKKPVIIPDGVSLTITDDKVMVKGAKGELSLDLPMVVKIIQDDSGAFAKVDDLTDKSQAALAGTFHRLLSNMVTGVSQGFTRELEINGVGYKAEVKGDALTLNLGFSHPIEYKLPAGIEAKVEKKILTLSGLDKQKVGQAAAEIRAFRKPEPYKGTGIKYSDEVIRRKVGKAAAKAE
ncbi:50S ribosomal protein L6 [bacterium]|nr:50S ribosomal protein L6 [bacterium]